MILYSGIFLPGVGRIGLIIGKSFPLNRLMGKLLEKGRKLSAHVFARAIIQPKQRESL